MFGRLARCRQWIEAVIYTLKGQLTLEQHGGRTLAGVYARVAARLLGLAAAIWRNWQTGAPSSDRSWPTITEDQLDSLI
jgi:hypothetical protein